MEFIPITTYDNHALDFAAVDVGQHYCKVDLATSVPVMRMYFHGGVLDYVLFQTWVPRSTTEYILTLVR
jgi:hypothetical protein